MIPPISPSVTSGANAPATPASGNNAAPTQSEFLQLLVTQLQNQDPTAPQDDTQFVAELAQFAQLEQTTNQTSILQAIQGQGTAQATAQATALLGHQVSASFNTVNLTAGAAPQPLQFTLAGNAASVTITLQNSSGQVVRTLQAGALAAGPHALAWDGNGDGGVSLPSGTYTVAVQAASSNNTPIGATTTSTGTVTGVTFDSSGNPLLNVNGFSVGMSSVSEIQK